MVQVAHTAKKVQRFYKTVDVISVEHGGDKGYAVTLDKRQLKSPKGTVEKSSIAVNKT